MEVCDWCGEEITGMSVEHDGTQWHQHCLPIYIHAKGKPLMEVISDYPTGINDDSDCL